MKWFLLLLFCFNIAGAEQTDIAPFIPLAEELRKDLSLSQEEEKARQESLLQEIISLIPDLGPTDNLEKAVQDFLGDDSYKIVNSKSTALHGNSDDEVFFFYDKDNSLKYVVKAFKSPEGGESSFLPELSGNSFLTKMERPDIVPATLISIGKCSVEDVNYGLLLETAVSGMRLDQYIYALEKNSELFLETIEAFTAVGSALAQLHQPDQERKLPLSQKWIDKVQSDLQELEKPEILELIQDQIDVESLKALVQSLLEGIQEIPFAASYQFGSAHLKNIFFDHENSRVSFIDTGKLHQSIDREGKPLADAAFDLIRMHEYLTRISLKILKEEERDMLKTALLSGYETIHPLPDERLLEFYTVHLALHKMLSYSDYAKQKDPEENFLIFQEHLKFLIDFTQKPAEHLQETL